MLELYYEGFEFMTLIKTAKLVQQNNYDEI